ncbi:hypothetical protein RIF29_17284 [Crotalaria pallida]|uniref:Ycf54 n=1 Tax=Crotalaria pallida TaxID=3830 RepID=A0AAN9FK77_CROPI
MLGVSTLTLGSSTAVAVQSQAQLSNLSAKVLALPGSKRQSLSFKTDSLLKGFVSFKESRPVRPFTTAVASVDSDQLSSSDPANKNETKKYHFLVANAKFMLDEEEHFQEQLFERLRYYGDRNMEQDFWLVIEPKFLDRFPDITKRLKRPAVALVSTNGPWIKFMKLRLDRVLTDSFEAEGLEEALASNPTNLEFDKPDKWVAPYPKYESGWWDSFLPPGQNEVKN